ncbi:CCA tRNA nucleotidyltransferase [Canibacter zhoujuaniae]|uniref:CCA tRNA nucleotidyltransferase n=1 Tax=Canibacter zhoujuaniae TaxID=2708343 RepID=UPI0014245CAF|nr:CCA tRNA nucleotidyltransferase [Canibacter zhoujuaniae]
MRPIAEAMFELHQIADSEPVQLLADAFSKAGYELALVGGPVRDAMLGRPVTDLDFTTNALPDKTREIVAAVANKTWDVGREYGTIAARVAGETVEITTYRAEIYRDDSRKPEVTFGDTIEDDLVRRDFTVNALAFMLPERRIVDVANGITHLMEGVLDTPSTPDQSFTDDPLRMLRAARFAAQLKFNLADRVTAALAEYAHRLEIISAERIRDEFVKLISCDQPIRGLRILVAAGLMELFLPELPALQLAQDEHKRHKDVYEHSLTVLEQAIALERVRFEAVDVPLRIAALLHDIGKPATRRFERGAVTFYNHDVVGAKLAKKRLKELRFDNDTVKQVARLIELHMRFFGYSEGTWTDSAVRRYVRDAGEQLEQLHILTRADVTTRNQKKARRLAAAYDEIERRIAELAEAEELAAIRPDLDGEQIMQLLEIKPGRAVGAAYRYLLEIRLEEGELGEEEATRRLLAWWNEPEQAKLR